MSFPASGNHLVITAAHWQPTHVLSLISKMKHVYFSFVDSGNISRQIKIAVQDVSGSLKISVYNELYEMSETGHL